MILTYISSDFVIRWNGRLVGKPVIDKIKIHGYRMLGMKPVSGVKRRVKGQSAVVVDLVTHDVVAPVQRQFVVEECFRYI